MSCGASLLATNIRRLVPKGRGCAAAMRSRLPSVALGEREESPQFEGEVVAVQLETLFQVKTMRGMARVSGIEMQATATG